MKKVILAVVMTTVLSKPISLIAQDSAIYYPYGNPKQWNVTLTPFFWIPWISGQIESNYLSQSFNVPISDLLSNLKMGFMMDAEVSKGNFFITPNYMYMKVGAEQVIRTSTIGNETAVAKPELIMNVAELMAGYKFWLNKKWSIDPYLGVRYNDFNTSIAVEGILDTTSVEKRSIYWDPVLGFRVNFLPHPRVLLTLKADVGGFGVGSRIATSAGLTGGYAVSPLIDLLAGFSIYAADFVNETKTGNETSFKAAFYGFNFGVRFILPKRYKDPAVFKKAKKK